MYVIRGYTNYECTEGPELEYGEFSNLSEAFQKFILLSKDENALDFSFLDAEVDEWMSDPEWEKDYYYGGYYGGRFYLYEVDGDDNWRELLKAERMREPEDKSVSLEEIEHGCDISEAEISIFTTLIEKTHV